MVRAKYTDKGTVVQILAESFPDNQSVNYILRQGPKKKQQVQSLMAYSFDMCMKFGKVFISDDRMSCALIMLPKHKKTTIKTILMDLKLIFLCTGVANVKKVLAREKAINAMQGVKEMYYVWFIGVAPKNQNKGIGSRLLAEIIKDAETLGLDIYLETSTVENLPWYKKAGFSEYESIDLSYTLHFLRLCW
ncbi:MAG: GNAT family N-acetyltransferase [Bacteroidota bacterium]